MIYSLWREYEDGTSKEGLWMKQMDKFECLVQAFEYEQGVDNPEEMAEFQGLRKKLTSDQAIAWSQLLSQERNSWFSSRQRRWPLIFVTGELPLLLDLQTTKGFRANPGEILLDCSTRQL